MRKPTVATEIPQWATKRQRQSLDQITRWVHEVDNPDRDDYEIKRLDFSWFEKHPLIKGRLIFVKSVVGLKNDEGTIAEVFARDDRHLSVGPNGGMKFYDHERDEWRRARTRFRTFLCSRWNLI